MASTAEELHGVRFEEFLRTEETASQRHEFVGGRVYVMAGGSERHDLASGLLYETLAPGARAGGCRPFTANRMLRAGTAGYYPDVFVACRPAGHRLYESDANVVIEVLSPTTVMLDRREKAAAYAQMPSLQMYLLVDPDQRQMESAIPEQEGLRWHVYRPGTIVSTPVGTIEVDSFYDRLDAVATT